MPRRSRKVRMTPQPLSAGAPASLSRLIELLTEQRDLYQQLHELSARQQEIIAQGQTEQLLVVLAERQGLVDQLTTINKDIAPLRQRMGDLTAAAPEADKQRVRDLIDDVQNLLTTIIERDEADRRQLEASKAAVGAELRRTNTAPAAVNAYRSNVYARASATQNPALTGVARFTDARG